MLNVGIYENVRILQTGADRLKPFLNKYGTLFIKPDNKIVFDVAGVKNKFKALQSLGDFSLLTCNEIWINMTDGDITFKRL